MAVTDFLSQSRDRVATQWREPMYRSGYLLVVSSVITALVGAAFWLIAARLYSPEVIGLNSAAVSAMMFLAGVAQLNLMSALLRFVPTAGDAALRMIIVSFLVAAGLGGLTAVVFLRWLPEWAPGLVVMLERWPVALSFILASTVWTVFVMLTTTLVAVGHAGAATVIYQLFNVAKVGLLVGFVALLPATGVWFAWTLATGLAVLVGCHFLFKRALPVFRASPTPVPAFVPSRRELARFIGPDYVASLAWIASTSLVPIVVLNLAGAERSAVFALAWSMCFVLYGVPAAFGQSLVAHGVREPHRLTERHRRILLSSLALLGPVVAVILVFAPLFLLPFGAWYASQGAGTVRLLALSALPNAVVALTVSRARVERDMVTVVVTMVGLAVVVLGLTLLLVPLMGIAGAGMAWLTGQLLVAGGIGLRRLRLVLVRAPRSRLPQRARRRALAVARESGWRVDGTLRTVSDASVVILSSPGRSAVLKIAGTSLGASALLRERDVLMQLGRDETLGHLRPLLPSVLDAGHHKDGAYLLLSRLPGDRARCETGSMRAAVAEAVRDAIGPLHHLKSATVVADESLLERWIDQPAARIAQALPHSGADRGALERLVGVLHRSVEGHEVTLGWAHGDLHPGNVLVAEGVVQGIIDWGGACNKSLPVLDLVHWLLTTELTGGPRELGGRVAGRLGAPRCWTGAEQRLLLSVPGGAELPARVLLLLSWLQHVQANLAKSERYSASPVWLRRNVLPVLRGVVHD